MLQYAHMGTGMTPVAGPGIFIGGGLTAQGVGRQKSPSGVQVQSSGRGSRGRNPLEAVVVYRHRFCLHNISKFRTIHFLITQRRSVAKRVGCFYRRLLACLCICLFVCLFVNTITSKRLNIG